MQEHQIILKYFPQLSQKQKEQISSLYNEYLKWNSQINVISRKDIDQLYERHVLHSLSIAKLVQFNSGAHILDAGTGGGFPGIPLAILFPDTQFHLVDSIGKKIKVVNEIASSLGLDNIKAEQARVEQLNEKYDFVVSRAVTQFDVFYKWVKNKISSKHLHQIKNGIIYLKGGDLKEELSHLNKKHSVYPIEAYFEEDFFISKKIVYVPL